MRAPLLRLFFPASTSLRGTPLFPAALALLAWLVTGVEARAATEATTAPPAPAATPTPAAAHLIYTGLTGGLTQARVEFAPLWTMFDAALSPPFRAGGFREDNVFRLGSRLLYTDQGPLTLRDLERFLSDGACTFGPPEPVALVQTDDALVLEVGTGGWGLPAFGELVERAGRFHTSRGRVVRRHRVVNAAGTPLFLLDATDASLDPCAPLAPAAEWEMVPAASIDLSRMERDGTLRRTRLLAAARPLGQGPRRSHLVRRWRAEAPQQTLHVDLGDALEPGTSEGARVRRAFTMKHLGELGLDALVPGETELALPANEWAQLAAVVPLVAANVEPLDAALPRPPGVLRRKLGPLRVALVGLTDDRSFEATGLAGPGAHWKVAPPLEAAAATLAQLRQLPLVDRPDLVVLATNVRDDRLQVMRQLDGASVVLADMDGLPGEVVEETVAVGGEERARGRKPLMVARSSPSRVGRLTAAFAEVGTRRNLVRLHNEAILVTDKLPAEPRWRHELNVLTDRHQRKRRELLLPDLRELDEAGEPLGLRFDTSRWNTLVAQLVWTRTGAEVAILRRLPLDYKVIGPVSRLAAERWLEVEDRLVDVVLPGKAIKALAAGARGALSVAGYDAGSGQALGGPISDDELYRVTTTDVTMRLPLLREHFRKRPMQDRWQRIPGQGLRPAATGGDPVTLRDHVLDTLKALKQRHGGAFDAAYRAELKAWLTPNGRGGPPRWTVRLDDGELLTNALRGAEDPAFSQVRNTRATAPSSLTLGGRGRLAVLYDSQDWGLEQRARGIYKRTTLTREGKEVVQETDDELALTSEVRLKRLSMLAPVGTVTPFGSGTYTTEFVPDTAEGVTKPRRSELAAIAGLLWAPGGAEREWRVGLALKNDLANPGMLEPGVYVAGGWERSLAPVLPARFKSGVELFRYAGTPTDTPDRLGLAATLNAGLAIPLWDRLTLNVGADWFVFTGKVAATDRLRASADFRVGLGYSLAWKPLHRLWF
ncbi:MAG: hypothetical protein VKQ33_02515 [Candidatus Sericytochromatia bacterium]|nr:hypothetical protein [Candidatus Sericytochromatia bacterium]